VRGVGGVDFGNFLEGAPYMLEGWKFYDRDEDGVMDDGEMRLPGWLVYLDMNDNGRYDPRVDIATRTDLRVRFVAGG